MSRPESRAHMEDSFDGMSTGSNALEIPERTFEDDSSYDRTFIISAAPMKLYDFLHPKTRTPAKYCISDGFFEVLRVDTTGHSIFNGDTVIRTSKVFALSAVHPLFLVIPYLCEQTPRMTSLSDLFSDLKCPAAPLLITHVKDLMDEVSDVTVKDNVMYITYNEAKLYNWLEFRFHKFMSAAEKYLQPTSDNNETSRRHYVFGIFSDQLLPELSKRLEVLWKIEKPSKNVVTTATVGKRKQQTLQHTIMKTPKTTAKQRQLKVASKGTPTLTNFFK